jgi:glutamate formiminotransferase
MRCHKGIHPRIGAVDVVPFVPLAEATLGDAIESAHQFGREFAKREQVPIYYYGQAALRNDRRSLSHIRKGGYEGLRDRFSKSESSYPDEEVPVFSLRKGATAVGARGPLVAFNVNLDSRDLDLARRIAFSIRESGEGFPAVMALGLFLENQDCVQISMNLLDYRRTSIRMVYDRICALAAENGVGIRQSEIIGLLPVAAMAEVSPAYLRLPDFSEDRFLESHF